MATFYTIELFAGKGSDKKHCPQACTQCAYAQYKHDNSKVGFSDDVLNTFDRLQEIIVQSNGRFNLALMTQVDKLDPQAMPTIDNCVETITFGAGDITQVSEENVSGLLKQVAILLDDKIAETTGIVRRLNIGFADNSGSFCLTPQDSKKKVKSLFDSHQLVCDQLKKMGFGPYLSLNISGNSVPAKEFERIVKNQTKLHETLLECMSFFEEDDSNISLDSPDTRCVIDHSPYKGIIRGALIIFNSMYEMYRIGFRYIKKTNGRAIQKDAFDPKAIALYPERILISHSPLSINVPSMYLDYGKFNAILDYVQRTRTPLEFAISDAFKKIP